MYLLIFHCITIILINSIFLLTITMLWFVLCYFQKNTYTMPIWPVLLSDCCSAFSFGLLFGKCTLFVFAKGRDGSGRTLLDVIGQMPLVDFIIVEGKIMVLMIIIVHLAILPPFPAPSNT